MPVATSFIVGTPACWAVVVSTPLQSLAAAAAPLLATTTTTITSASAAARPTINWVRRLPLDPPRPLKRPAIREANPGPFGAAGAGDAPGPAAGSGGSCLWRGWGRGRRGPPASAGLRDLRKLSLRGEQPQVLHEPLGERVRLGVALQMADRVGAADRIGLTEQVVAQADLRIGVGAADLLQGRPCPVPHLVGRDAEQRADVLVR